MSVEYYNKCLIHNNKTPYIVISDSGSQNPNLITFKKVMKTVK